MMNDQIRSGWRWVPTTYFAEGAPFMTVFAVTPILFSSIGMDNTSMAVWSSLLTLPWSVKPLWAPLLDFIGTKRRWIIGCQFTLAILFGVSALLMGINKMSSLLLGAFFLLAMASATHDVAADGFYMIALDSYGQSFFAGIRSTFYRVATVSVQGGLVALAGAMQSCGWTVRQGWSLSLVLAAVCLACLSVWHIKTLPAVETSSRDHFVLKDFLKTFWESITSFFRLPHVWELLIFLLFFRMAESMLGKLSGVFLIAPIAKGGLGLSLAEQGFFYGTVGVIALTIGGILGGFFVARFGLRYCAWPLAAALNLPDLVYVYLAWTQTQSRWAIGSCIAVEQFGYGLGYTVFMMVMLAAAANSGKYRTSHFAFMTALSILAMSICGMVSGALQSSGGHFNLRGYDLYLRVPALPFDPAALSFSGYYHFFWYVIYLLPLSFFVLWLVIKDIPKEFGTR